MQSTSRPVSPARSSAADAASTNKRAGYLGVGLHAVLPTVRFGEPGKRTGGMALGMPALREDGRQMLELAVAMGKELRCGLAGIGLKDDILGRRQGEAHELDGIIRHDCPLEKDAGKGRL